MAAHHVENPFEFAIEKAAWAVRDVARFVVPHPERHATQTVPEVRRITLADLREALREGAGDVGAFRDDVLFIGIIYPVAGALLAAFAFNQNLLMMLFPLVSGFAILGPVAATGLYEMSRRRENGEPVALADIWGTVRSRTELGWMAFVTLFVFVIWMYQVRLLIALILGINASFSSVQQFITVVLTTNEGLLFLAIGNAVGAALSLILFSLTVVSFPLLLDRDVDFVTAMMALFIVLWIMAQSQSIRLNVAQEPGHEIANFGAFRIAGPQRGVKPPTPRPTVHEGYPFV